MADIMSIPSEIRFKEMLSHTFPGFFLASSLFMLIDYLSPDNLTAWAIGSLTNLVTFAGFIIIIGTILGVIIDGIHHTFIEDDIFDNFIAVHQLKEPIKEQLKANCPSYSDNLSRHFFLSKIGTNAIPLEEHLDQAYYRYSEFYSNIFISLIVFSIISPFYIFEVLELPWKTSALIGIASLLTACFCLASSYTSYKMYLQAQCSAICGFIKGAEGKCSIKCNDMPSESYEDAKIKASMIVAALLIPAWLYLSLNMDIISWILTGIIGMCITAIIIKLLHITNSQIKSISILGDCKEVDNNGKVIEYLEKLSKETDVIGEKVKEDIKNVMDLAGYNDDSKLKSEENKKIKDSLEKLSDEYSVSKTKERISTIIKLIKYNKKSNVEFQSKKYIFYWNKIPGGENRRLIDYLKKNFNIDWIKEENIEKPDENRISVSLKPLSLELNKEKTEAILKIDNSEKEKFVAKTEKVDLCEKLSKSSYSALCSLLSSLFICMIVLAIAYTPINLNIEPSNIMFTENITDKTSIKEPIGTLSFKNLGERLNNIKLEINGIEKDWLNINYIKNDDREIEKGNQIKEIASGETKFVQIKLNSSAMDRANISQGLYIGSIDINYSNGLKSIPLCINLTKK